MLGIRYPDRHALLRITSSKLRRPRRLLPSRASGFVLRRVSPVAVRPDEGPFTIPFADLYQCKPVEFTAYALASRLRAGLIRRRRHRRHAA
jgi:hypothetical protein